MQEVFSISKLFKRLIDYLVLSDREEGEHVIANIGHRTYVGGLWDELGLLQFQFLLEMGLKPSDCLFDIGCGSLRGGRHFIKYLNEGKYIGIDKDLSLIEYGLKEELNREDIRLKDPNFIVNEKFNFKESRQKPDISIAHSLFTHLNLNDISLCLNNLRKIVKKDHMFYATFKEGNSLLNRKISNSFSVFFYSFKTLRNLASSLGWKASYIGEWGHPRNQKMIKFVAI